jgi:hypothetical protein
MIVVGAITRQLDLAAEPKPYKTPNFWLHLEQACLDSGCSINYLLYCKLLDPKVKINF